MLAPGRDPKAQQCAGRVSFPLPARSRRVCQGWESLKEVSGYETLPRDTYTPSQKRRVLPETVASSRRPPQEGGKGQRALPAEATAANLQGGLL